MKRSPQDSKRLTFAIMMRTLDQNTGLRYYTECLVRELLSFDERNQYLLLYRKRDSMGLFSDADNARELLVKPSHKLIWDQISVPYVSWREESDLIFNPKFSVPLISHSPVTMGLQEPVWWAKPQYHPWWDVLWMRISLPMYCRRASHFFPWSEFVLSENQKYLGHSFDNATLAPAAPHPYFRVIEEQDQLDKYGAEKNLPERFMLSVTRVQNIGNEGTTFTDTKNVTTTVKAYLQCRDRIPHKLVIAGDRVKEFLLTRNFSEQQLDGIHFLGFVPHEELPLVYNLAEYFVLPSYYEGFAITLVEAMSCGCPIIASNTGACPETTGGAALLADPEKPEEFSELMVRVGEDAHLRDTLGAKSLQRAADFSWKRTARRVLDALEQTALQH